MNAKNQIHKYQTSVKARIRIEYIMYKRNVYCKVIIQWFNEGLLVYFRDYYESATT